MYFNAKMLFYTTIVYNKMKSLYRETYFIYIVNKLMIINWNEHVIFNGSFNRSYKLS